MANIARDAITVGDVIDHVIDQTFLDGIYRERPSYHTQADEKAVLAVRHALGLVKDELHKVWCPDTNTQLAEVEVPR